MRLYLDTEFTDLIPEAKLISIALVDDTGDYFYAELNDNYELKDCSAFVKANVLPLLLGGEYLMSWNECALKIGNWIEARGQNCIFACDNPAWDMPFVKKLLRPYIPENIKLDTIFPVYMPPFIYEEIVLANNFKIHNALDDAKIMRLGTIKLGR